MTREEAIEMLKKDKEQRGDCFISDAIDMAIKALEQEPILDKLRAEIDKIYEREGSSFDCLNALDELKEFIDKYKSESEDK